MSLSSFHFAVDMACEFNVKFHDALPHIGALEFFLYTCGLHQKKCYRYLPFVLLEK